MIQGHVFLVLLLMLIGATVLWTFITTSKYKMGNKSIANNIDVVFHCAWVGLETIYGYLYKSWPNNEKYIMVGSYVEEPEIKDPDSRAIYLWLIDNNPTIKDNPWFDIILQM